MKKIDEFNDPTSCLNKARNDEMIFVLLGRDAAAPHAIQCWIHKRLELGLNKPMDGQIAQVETCAAIMEKQSGPDILGPDIKQGLRVIQKEDTASVYKVVRTAVVLGVMPQGYVVVLSGCTSGEYFVVEKDRFLKDFKKATP